MEFLERALEEYIEIHSDSEPQLLQELSRETHLKIMKPRMLSGHVQGRFLSFISKLIRPNRILEIGTYTGYATICLSEGLREKGEIITLDKNEELFNFTSSYFEKAGLSEKIDFRIGNALEIIPELKGPFDIIFIDADKMNYSNYFDLCFDLLSENGIILADNVLWSGKITMENADKQTKALQEFNNKIQSDTRVENMILSIRDGIMLIRKK